MYAESFHWNIIIIGDVCLLLYVGKVIYLQLRFSKVFITKFSLFIGLFTLRNGF